MLKDDVFLLNISTATTSNNGSINSNNRSNNIMITGGQQPCSSMVPEILIHRRIIEMYTARDDFNIIDLNINTCRTLSNPTKVDIANALQHMKLKSKTLRRLTADIDYMDPSVHEFVLLTCLEFDEICITSTPFEQTYISSGIAMSIRHALTANQRCIRHLDLSCGISEETCGILSDALKQLQLLSKTVVVLEYFRLNLLTGNPGFVSSIVEGLIGISSLKTLHLGGTANPHIGEPLNQIFLNNKCDIRELHLDFGGGDAEADHCSGSFFDTKAFVGTFLKQPTKNTTNATTTTSCCNKSLKQFYSNGINYMNRNDLQGLATMFPNLETLALTQCSISKLGFLDDLLVAVGGRSTSWDDKRSYHHRPHHHHQQQQQQQQLFQNLTTCDFTNTMIDIGEIQRLVRILPNITNITGFPYGVVEEDPIICHYLEWNKYGRILNIITNTGQEQKPVPESVWPIVLERANIKLEDADANENNTNNDLEGGSRDGCCCDRRASLIFCLLKDLTRLRVQSSKEEEEEDEKGGSSSSSSSKSDNKSVLSSSNSNNNHNDDENDDNDGDDEEEKKKEDAGNVFDGDDNGFFNNDDNDGDY